MNIHTLFFASTLLAVASAGAIPYVSFSVSGNDLSMTLSEDVVFTGNASAVGGSQMGVYIMDAFSTNPSADYITQRVRFKVRGD